MIKKLLSLIIALGILQLLPVVEFVNIPAFIIASLVLSILVFCIEPILKLFSLPLIIATLGLFRIVLLVGSIWFTTFLVPGFVIYPMIFFGIHIHYFATLAIVSILFKSLHALVCKLLRC